MAIGRSRQYLKEVDEKETAEEEQNRQQGEMGLPRDQRWERAGQKTHLSKLEPRKV